MNCLKMTSAAPKFREFFKVPKEKIVWYPGHMKSSFKNMQAIIKNMDCVVEVHDARIPISGRNPIFLKRLIGLKPHILVLNKKDLIDKSNCQLIVERCQEGNADNVIFTNCLDAQCTGLKKIVPMAIELIHGGVVQPREEMGYKMMVVGVPNVGKSSVINALRNITCGRGKATAVGAIAGVTRSVQTEIRVSTNPPIYLVDTPGILEPNIKDTESGMKLALCSCLNDSVVGVTLIADFLLYWMNKMSNFAYVDYFHLSQPVDEIFPLLLKIAVDNNQKRKVKNLVKNTVEVVPDVEAAAFSLVGLFRKGEFGDLELDRDKW